MTRACADKLKYMKPSTLYASFFPALQGKGTKMSSSVYESAILLTDKPKDIDVKIKKYAFSGGQENAEKQR